MEWLEKEYDILNYMEENGLKYSFPRNLFGKSESKHNMQNNVRRDLFKMIKNNTWIEYFMEVKSDKDETWIDFESEISQVIQSIDDDMHSSTNKNFTLNDKIKYISNEFLKWKYSSWIDRAMYQYLRDDLVRNLDRLIRALEIYLAEYVEKIDISKKSPDINEIDIDYILSFNYTHTYSKLYEVSEKTEKERMNPFDYIHGEASLKNTKITNNMVLGIDEYLPDKRKNKDVEFIAFKKFYQRIHKQTGCRYKDWINEIIQENTEYLENIRQKQLDFDKNRGLGIEGEKTITQLKLLKANPPRHNLYIYGHSLDITDRDILRDLILNDNIYTTIFYLNKDVLGKQITNLVKVIGQDELIKRTGGSARTIIFKQQKDMEPIHMDR